MAGRGRGKKLERPRPLRSLSVPCVTTEIPIGPVQNEHQTIRPTDHKEHVLFPTVGRGRGKIQKPRPLRSISVPDATSPEIQPTVSLNTIYSPVKTIHPTTVTGVRNLPPVTPKKTETQLKKEMENVLTEIDMIQMNLPTYKWNHPEVRRMLELVRKHGSAMEYHMREDVENLFDDFRDLVKSNHVNSMIRSELLEVIEDRARGWMMDDDTRYYYIQKSKQMTAQKERFLVKKVKVIQDDVIDMNSVVPVYDDNKITLHYSFKFEIPVVMTETLTGKREDRIRLIESISGTRISLSRESSNGAKQVSVFGPTEGNILNCVYIINDTLKTNEAPTATKYSYLGLYDNNADGANLPSHQTRPRIRRIESMPAGDGWETEIESKDRLRRYSDSSLKRHGESYSNFSTKNSDSRSVCSSGFGDVDEDPWDNDAAAAAAVTTPIKESIVIPRNSKITEEIEENSVSEDLGCVSKLSDELPVDAPLAELPVNGVYTRSFLCKCYKSPFSSIQPADWETIKENPCLRPILGELWKIPGRMEKIDLYERFGCNGGIVRRPFLATSWPRPRSGEMDSTTTRPRINSGSSETEPTSRPRINSGSSETEPTNRPRLNSGSDENKFSPQINSNCDKPDSINTKDGALIAGARNEPSSNKLHLFTTKEEDNKLEHKTVAEIALPDSFDGELSLENLKIEEIPLPEGRDSDLDESLPGEWDVEMEIKFHSTTIGDIPLPSSSSSESDVSPPPPAAPTAPTPAPSITRSKFQPNIRPLLSIPQTPMWYVPYPPRPDNRVLLRQPPPPKWYAPYPPHPEHPLRHPPQPKWYAPHPPHPQELLRRRMMQPAFHPISFSPICNHNPNQYFYY
ncbi:uncharacterized protein LOC141901128 [Tubulanus polymorphus]|uniref:uncharacterized protein LOC141901128 n=1 Tax=Tubulanus polymorphus TaxID=672921 RepID=UPI003DA1FF3A